MTTTIDEVLDAVVAEQEERLAELTNRKHLQVVELSVTAGGEAGHRARGEPARG